MSDNLNNSTDDTNPIIQQEVHNMLQEPSLATDNETFVPTQPPTPEKKHSKLGIASFALAFISFIITLIGFGISIKSAAGMADPAMAMDPNNLPADVFGAMMVAGVVIFLGSGLSFIGLILGVVALFMKNVKKIFAILGAILNGLPLVVFLVLIVIGITMAGNMSY